MTQSQPAIVSRRDKSLCGAVIVLEMARWIYAVVSTW
jgi:hypothetical protein